MTDDFRKKDGAARLPVHVYSSARKTSLPFIFKSLVKELGAAHSLGFRFAERSFRARYRQSLFGMLWAFLPPLATAFIWIMLNRVNVVRMTDVGVPYPLYVISGTMLWAVFSNSVLQPMQTMQANRNILVKVNFPREALVFNAFYEMLFNTCFTLAILVIILIVFHVPVGFSTLLFLPVMFLLMLLGMALGLLLLPVSLLYKDVQFFLPMVLQFAMYLTPVVYTPPAYHGAARILAYNPVTPLLTTGRAALLGTEMTSSPVTVFLVGGVAILLLLFGVVLQRITIETAIERMGS